MVVKSRNAFGTLGTWTDYERGYGDPNWKDVNWGGWDASDADFFGDARKFFEDHQVYGQHVGDMVLKIYLILLAVSTVSITQVRLLDHIVNGLEGKVIYLN